MHYSSPATTQEVERIEGEMLLIVLELGYQNMTLQEFAEMVRTDENNFYNSSEALLQVGRECYVMLVHIFKAFHDIIENRIEGKLLDVFHSKPKTALEIVEVLFHILHLHLLLLCLHVPKLLILFLLLLLLLFLEVHLLAPPPGACEPAQCPGGLLHRRHPGRLQAGETLCQH